MRFTLLMLLTVLLFGAGCDHTRIQGAKIAHVGITSITAVQGEDAKDKSNLNTEALRQSEFTIPQGSVINYEIPVTTVVNGVPVITNRPATITLASNAVYKTIATDKVNTTAGAAQKNSFQDIAAKLSSLKWLTYVGVVLFLFGVATAVYPPLKLIVGGSMTTSAAIAGAGLALTFLPVLVVGHELLILGVALGGVGLYWFAHRHGTLKGELTAVKDALTTKTDTTATDTKTEA